MYKRYSDQLPLSCPQPGTQPATQAGALTGNQISSPSVHRPALNPLSHTSQGWKKFTFNTFPLPTNTEY